MFHGYSAQAHAPLSGLNQQNTESTQNDSDDPAELSTYAPPIQTTSPRVSALRCRVFSDISLLKQQRGEPLSFWEVDNLFNASIDYFHFCWLLNLSPVSLDPIFMKHQACMGELRLNTKNEMVLAKIIAYPSLNPVDFAAANGLSLSEFNQYLETVFHKPYWEIKLSKKPVCVFLNILRQTRWHVLWDRELANFFGCSPIELFKLSLKLFFFPLAQSIHALKQMGNEEFAELVYDCNYPIDQLSEDKKQLISLQLRKSYLIHFNSPTNHAPINANLFISQDQKWHAYTIEQYEKQVRRVRTSLNNS